MNETRSAREQDYWNRERRGAGEARRSVAKYYSIGARRMTAYDDAVSREAVRAGRALEIGCSFGATAIGLAAHCEVVGIDISDVAIETAAERAGPNGNVSFRVMDAHHLSYPDDTFGLVYGSAILHHLELSRAMSEIQRVARPGGSAIFLEPLGHNPLINAYRRTTPDARTEDERPLRVEDLNKIADGWTDAALEYFDLTTLSAVPLRAWRGFPMLVNRLAQIDRLLFSFPSLRKHAWFVLIHLTK